MRLDIDPHGNWEAGLTPEEAVRLGQDIINAVERAEGDEIVCVTFVHGAWVVTTEAKEEYADED